MTGIEHGTSTIIFKDIPIEITTFREKKRMCLFEK